MKVLGHLIAEQCHSHKAQVGKKEVQQTSTWKKSLFLLVEPLLRKPIQTTAFYMRELSPLEMNASDEIGIILQLEPADSHEVFL